MDLGCRGNDQAILGREDLGVHEAAFRCAAPVLGAVRRRRLQPLRLRRNNSTRGE
ncbi:hypothetical protein E1H18_4223 [Caulobacter sp. RHG1]|nr:hypothetical protein [Caulobacter sp. RHG1]